MVNPEMQKRIDAMGPSEMEETLLSLEGTQQYIAALKYLQMRFAYAQSNLLTQDPNTSATVIARTQGILSGIVDLPSMIRSLREKKERETEKIQRESQE